MMSPSSQLPSAARDLLDRYAALVREWAGRLDLVSPGDLPRFEQRHVDDALRALPLLDSLPGGAAVDVGSGGGVPGVPLAIARPEREWRLLEPRARRAAFLEEVVRALDLDCEVVPMTADEAAHDARLCAAHAVATGRALAAPRRAARLLLPLVAPGGAALLWVGRTSELPPGAEEWAPGLAIIRGDFPKTSHDSHRAPRDPARERDQEAGT